MALNFPFIFLQSDIFGSLNDQGLLSRASEVLVAMDMKHPVSSAHQVFPPIKSDMMYSHPAISSAAAAASGTSISRSSNHVSLIILLLKELLRIGQSSVSMTKRSRAYVYDSCGVTKTSLRSNPLTTYVKETLLPRTKTK